MALIMIFFRLMTVKTGQSDGEYEDEESGEAPSA
jgi:hypothetical protein